MYPRSFRVHNAAAPAFSRSSKFAGGREGVGGPQFIDPAGRFRRRAGPPRGSKNMKGSAMKSNMIISVMVAGAWLGVAGLAMSNAAGPSVQLSEPCLAKGDLTVTVRHVVTNELLGGMPVQLLAVVKVDPKSAGTGSDTRRLVLVTGKNGVVRFSNLKDGLYQTWVFHNQVSSEVQTFQISPNTPSVSLTVYFNPDIDAGR
jgi:hypothetical protein